MLTLNDNIYNKRQKRSDKKLKLWRSAGVLLTYKCNCSCQSCYYNCCPQKDGLIPTETVIDILRSMKILAGDLAKVHFTGGEAFLYFDHLAEILTEVKKQDLGPIDLIETNAFWATDDNLIKKRLGTLDNLGMRTLKISCDPFHQQFVDIKLVKRLAKIAVDILGPDRVMVRWEKYLEDRTNYKNLSGDDLDKIFISALRDYPCRYNGRAIKRLAPLVADKKADELESQNCQKAFLGAKGVHIDPFGNIFSGTCSGIIVGNVNDIGLHQVWKKFDPQNTELIKTVFEQGPFGLLEIAEKKGYKRLDKYASKCHLCASIRQHLNSKTLYKDTFGPDQCYCD